MEIPLIFVIPLAGLGVYGAILITELIVSLFHKDKRNIIRKGKTDWK